MEYHESLGLPREEFADLSERFESDSYEGWEYRRLPSYRKSVEKGTVLIGETVVRGFPKVPRSLVLDEGIPQQFDEPIAVEEKLNGYNVRVARIEGEVFGFTRSGIICPFTTHKVRELLPVDRFFDRYPDKMLCGEMIGPENPYTVAECYDVDSIAFRAFDIRDRESGEPLPVEERREKLTDRYVAGELSERELEAELDALLDDRSAGEAVRDITAVESTADVDRELERES